MTAHHGSNYLPLLDRCYRSHGSVSALFTLDLEPGVLFAPPPAAAP